MNLKKLILTTTLALTLGLGACGTPTPSTSTSEAPSTSETPSTESSSSSSSEIPAVSRIKIDAPASVIVGEEVDLDEYVTVEGGEGPKAYTVEVTAAYADKVTVDGHKITALAEGEISVTIKAGAKTAKFSTSALSALKAAWAEMTGDLTTEWALHELYQGQVYPNSVVHRSDYTLFDGWDQDAEGNYLKGGFLLAQNGNTYQYVLDGNELLVDSTIQSSFGNYYCNMQWCLSASDFSLVQATDSQTGEPFEYLIMTSDVPCVQYSNQFDSQIEFFMYTCALALNEAYYFSELIVQPTILQSQDGTEYNTFTITAYVRKAADNSIAGTYSYILETRNEISECKAVRDYIDGGHAPAAVDATPLATTFATIAAAGNYTLNVQTGWFNKPNTPISSSSATAIADPLDETFPAVYHAYFTAGQETVKVDATGSQTVTIGANVAGAAIEASLPRIEGYEIVDGTLYTYSNEVVDPTTGEATLNTTLSYGEAGGTVEAYLSTYTLAPLAAIKGEHFKVLGFADLGGGAKQWAVECVPLFQVITNASYLAWFPQYLLANGWQNDMTAYLDTVILETGTGLTLCNFSLAWDQGQYYVIDIVIGNVGTTTVSHPKAA